MEDVVENKGAQSVYDIDDMTMDEIEELEELIDVPLDSIGKPNTKKAKLMKAIVYIIEKRTNPAFTLEDAGKLKLSEINIAGGDEGN